MLEILSFSHILLKRVLRDCVGKTGRAKSAIVKQQAEVHVVLKKVGIIESVTPPLNLIENEEKNTNHD